MWFLVSKHRVEPATTDLHIPGTSPFSFHSSGLNWENTSHLPGLFSCFWAGCKAKEQHSVFVCWDKLPQPAPTLPSAGPHSTAMGWEHSQTDPTYLESPGTASYRQMVAQSVPCSISMLAIHCIHFVLGFSLAAAPSTAPPHCFSWPFSLKLHFSRTRLQNTTSMQKQQLSLCGGSTRQTVYHKAQPEEMELETTAEQTGSLIPGATKIPCSHFLVKSKDDPLMYLNKHTVSQLLPAPDFIHAIWERSESNNEKNNNPPPKKSKKKKTNPKNREGFLWQEAEKKCSLP